MAKVEFDRAVENIVSRDQRFTPEAYALVRDSLNHTLDQHASKRGGDAAHLRGPELLHGFRSYLISQYGPMVPTLLENWGITCTRDIGEIVFHLIEEEVFSKSPDDRIEDFENVFDFYTAFVVPFLPGGKSRVTE